MALVLAKLTLDLIKFQSFSSSSIILFSSIEDHSVGDLRFALLPWSMNPAPPAATAPKLQPQAGVHCPRALPSPSYSTFQNSLPPVLCLLTSQLFVPFNHYACSLGTDLLFYIAFGLGYHLFSAMSILSAGQGTGDSLDFRGGRWKGQRLTTSHSEATRSFGFPSFPSCQHFSPLPYLHYTGRWRNEGSRMCGKQAYKSSIYDIPTS